MITLIGQYTFFEIGKIGITFPSIIWQLGLTYFGILVGALIFLKNNRRIK